MHNGLHRVRHHYRTRRLLQTSSLLFTAFFLASCSLWTTPKSTSVPLPIEGSGSWQRLQVSPYVYQHTDATQQRTFLTGIKDCENRKARPATEAARQLLVGLKDIRIQEREEVVVDSFPALRSRVKATLDDQPLELLTYTLTQDKCIFDFVLWRPDNGPGSQVEPLIEHENVFAGILNLP